MCAPLLKRAIPLLIASVISASVVVATASAGQGHRALRLVRSNPATVHGTGFRPRAVVHVTLAADGNHRARTRADRAGAFTVTFSSTIVDRCTAWTVTAIQGSAAPLVVHGPRPGCPPA